MRYIIMCGGNYREWETPRQLLEVRGEPIVARTIRLLKDAGATDIAISSNDDRFEGFGVPVLRHENNYYCRGYDDYDGYWCNCFYPTDEPTCYIFGDVVFSPEAIGTIVRTPVDDIELFGSRAPFAKEYVKKYVEPFALKVMDTDRLKKAIEETKALADEGAFFRHPLMWELWTVIKGAPIQKVQGKYRCRYMAVNDYTCDVDSPDEIPMLERIIANETREA